MRQDKGIQKWWVKYHFENKHLKEKKVGYRVFLECKNCTFWITTVSYHQRQINCKADMLNWKIDSLKSTIMGEDKVAVLKKIISKFEIEIVFQLLLLHNGRL